MSFIIPSSFGFNHSSFPLHVPHHPRPDPLTALRDEVTDDPSRPETLGPQISNPGYPKIVGEGFVWSLGLTITVAR